MPSSQLNTSTCRPNAWPSALTDSVLPVPAGPYGLPPAGYAEGYHDNVCILPNAGDAYMVSGGDLADAGSLASGLVLANNSIYAPGGDASVTMGGEKVDFRAHKELRSLCICVKV